MPTNTDPNSTTTRSFPELIDRQPSFISRNINQPINDFVGIFRNRYNDSYASGIFELPLPESYDALGEGKPDMSNKAIQFFKQTLSDYHFSLPHSAKWIVMIEPHNQEHLMSEIGKIKNFEEGGGVGNAWVFDDKVRKLTSDQAQKTIGCIFALGVTQVGETVGTSMAGGSNGVTNGFLKSPVTSNRADMAPFEVVVRETNSSYTDFVLRPWTILTSHKGLFARPVSESIKATITVYGMAYSDAHEESLVRKMFVYHNCAPISVNAETLSYETASVVQRQIQFTYTHYTVHDGDNFGESSGKEVIEAPSAHLIV